MSEIVRAARRSARSPNVGMWTACFTAMLTVFLVWMVWALVCMPLLCAYLGGFVVELVALGVVTVFHAVSHAGGWTGAGAGAGLRLAALSLAARVEYEAMLRYFAYDTWRSVYDALPSLGSPVWHVRNVGAVAFAYGLALTVFAVLRDVHLRRRYPAWVPSLED